MSLDGQSIDYTPEKNDYIVNVKCDKDAEAYWDTELWGLVVKNFEKGIKCSVDFETKYLTNYIKYLANTSDELLVDETEDKNIRYVGANPNNYVLFNNELWRIIGVMNNVQNEQNESETRVKLVRASSIGKYSWDYKADGTYGGDWSTSTLQELLNGAYYKKTTGTYYNYVANTEPTLITVDFTEIGLSEEARNQIGLASWYIGRDSSNQVSESYKREKQTLFQDYIGLVNISDAVYSVQGGGETSRNQCLNMTIMNILNLENDCVNSNWLRNGNNWAMNASPYTNTIMRLNGDNFYSYNALEVVTVVYLKINVYYVSGTGSSTDPFIIK